jgi:hypothetical protein
MANSKGWKPGRWKAVCDRCGFRYHSDKLNQEWTGLRVCPSCIESRNPQDFLKLPTETIVPPWTRPEVPDTFVTVNYILGEDGALYENLDAIYLDSFSIEYRDDN